MNNISDFFKSLTAPDLLHMVAVFVFVIVGVIVSRLFARAVYVAVRAPMGEFKALLVRRFLTYAMWALVLLIAMHELGLRIGIFLGAAGVLSVALGFASQTSASNLISGLFLVGEKSFAPGDTIRVADITGEVLSVDMLSVKLRTFDNLYVRVPNETLIKAQIVNLTRFPIRRLDLLVGIAYKEDLPRVRDILLEVADAYPLCLDQPRPVMIFLGFGDSALNLQFSVWAFSENFMSLRNTIPELVKKAFDEAGIEIPFPHRTLYAGSVTEPFPVTVVKDP